MGIRIVLADGHRMVRDALKFLLGQEAGILVVGMAENGKAAVQLAKTLRPDVVVMDVAMPELNGADATRAIMSEAPGVRVIGLSASHGKRSAIRMLGAGASGHLLKDCAPEELVQAIRTVASGHRHLSHEVLKWVADDYARGSSEKDPAFSSMTPREREVLQLVAEGKSTREIASGLHVSIKTVETFRSHIMKKLDLHNVADLTKYAIMEGLTSVDT